MEIGLMNLEFEDCVRKVVEDTQTNLQDALDSGNCNRIRILMRFLTVLMCSKVLQPSSLVVVFETLLSSAATTVDEEKGNPSWQACADFYITCILSCLPWGGAELMEQVPEEIEGVMVGIEAYLSIRRHASDNGLSFFDDNDEAKNGEKDFLEDLWSRVQDLSTNGWKLESVPRPHLSFEAQLVSAWGLWYLFLSFLFLGSCKASRKECASFMVGLPVPFRYEYLMAETIFSQLLMLPEPPFKPIYYTLVIIDLCKALPGAFPAVVAGGVRALFERIADLDMECRTRLILWFSHHLANFQFIWPWEEWAYVLDLPKWAPQRVFVQEVLEREVRLSYWEKVKQSIENAPGLEELLPPKGGPNFRFSVDGDTERTEQHALSADLSSMMKGRATSREIISWIEESVVPLHGQEVALKVVVQTFLDMGSKSFTHLITVLERYGQAIAKICPDEDKQVMLIAEVGYYWRNNPQMAAIAIDRMMGYRLISNLAIVRWVFSPENVEQFHTSDHPWEVLRNAVSKTYNRISDLRKEISSLKTGIVAAEEAAEEAKTELEAAESKLTLVDGEPVLGENPVRLSRLKSRAEKAKEEEVSARESLEAKDALLARALDEIEALLLSLYKNFCNVLMERLPDASIAGSLRELSQSNGGRTSDVYNIGEKEQWCLTTLGYVKAFSRQYASEIWPHIEKLEAEVLPENVHPLFRRAIYCGLRRPINWA
ncbi:Nuclear cap-binding protein subunit 1 [Morella rubra]|uniref:Nuclear cap-binding protein subunit 1 n=1 Tax=Morella rubra TaxID=262757 RepID=A0A6A1WS03_9ROSI|nr:Nuclear cap-binding protein subunit 1 [Morella rubra]